jgi:membrane protein implicated in regulation of membrane protease activity
MDAWLIWLSIAVALLIAEMFTLTAAVGMLGVAGPSEVTSALREVSSATRESSSAELAQPAPSSGR